MEGWMATGKYFMLSAWLCFSVPGGPAWGEPLVFANATALLTGLVPLAANLGLYERQGLELSLVACKTGVDAVHKVLSGEADVATVAETALTVQLFDHRELQAMAMVGGWDNEVRLMARKDSGITTAEHLRGKKVGTQHGTSLHFFLEQYLLKHGMSMADIVPISLHATELPMALAEGKVQVISARDPFLTRAQSLMANQVVVLEEPGLYYKVFVMVARAPVIQQKKQAFVQLLRALVEAEQRLLQNPEAGRAFLAEISPEGAEDVIKHWQDIRLRVWLDHKLLLTMEAAADWAVRNRLVSHGPVPDFTANFYPEILKTVRPVAVNLFY